MFLRTSRGFTPPWTACAPGLRGGAGPREGAEEAGPQPDAHRLHHPGGRRGRVGLDRGCHRLGALRDLRNERFLAPTLSSGQVVVLDGLGAHRTHRVRELVEARGADLLFLERPTRPTSTALGRHAPGRGGLVRPLRLSTVVNTAVRAQNTNPSSTPPYYAVGTTLPLMFRVVVGLDGEGDQSVRAFCHA